MPSREWSMAALDKAMAYCFQQVHKTKSRAHMWTCDKLVATIHPHEPGDFARFRLQISVIPDGLTYKDIQDSYRRYLRLHTLEHEWYMILDDAPKEVLL